MTDVNEMIGRWFDIIKYDEETERTGLSFNDHRKWYAALVANSRLSNMQKDNAPDMLLFCVLRHSVEIHKHARITVRDAMSPQIAKLMDFIREAEESPMNENLTHLRRELERIAPRPDLVRGTSEQEICRHLSEAGPIPKDNPDGKPERWPSVSEIKEECLWSSGRPLSGQLRISEKIVLASSLGELLLKTSGMPDGMVLGYVVRGNAGEGYFSLMYKSNGSIISINDRPMERYFGQYEVIYGRSVSYTEDMTRGLFPYGSVTKMALRKNGRSGFIDKDGKRRKHLFFGDISDDEALRFFTGCLLISYGLEGKVYGQSCVKYATGLLGDSLQLLESKGLVNAENRNIAEAYHRLRLEIPQERIVSPPEQYTDSRTGRKNTSPVLFREFFTPDMAELHSDYSEILPRICSEYAIEMVASREDIEQALLHEIRRKLRDRIQERIDACYHEHGDGIESVKTFRKIVLERKDVLLKNLTVKYQLDDPEKWQKKRYWAHVCNDRYYFWDSLLRQIDAGDDFLPFNVEGINEFEKSWKSSDRIRKHEGKVYLRDEGGICSRCFVWNPVHTDEICGMLEISEDMLPKEMRGYDKYCNFTSGDEFLEMTDDCQQLQNGYHSAPKGLKSPFDVVIFMSNEKWQQIFGTEKAEQ